MADCIIRSGESVDPSDSRLSDTACVIETGVIIRPPPDLSIPVDFPVPPPAQSVSPLPVYKSAKESVKIISSTPAPVTRSAPVPVPASPPVVVTDPATDVNRAAEKLPMTGHTSVPDHVPVEPLVEESPSILNPTTAMIAAGAVVAVVGTAAAGSATGGFSSIQAKISSLLGTSKATVVTTTVVTAGTIVAVKALENKMNTLERDLAKTKKEVGDAASSIDKIDAMLDKLGR